jgi:hypothetical protein
MDSGGGAGKAHPDDVERRCGPPDVELTPAAGKCPILGIGDRPNPSTGIKPDTSDTTTTTFERIGETQQVDVWHRRLTDGRR